MPNDKQGKAIAVILALQYLVFIPLWRAESIPPLLGHIVVWLLYAGFVLLLRSALSASTTMEPDASPAAAAWPRRRLIQWAGALLLLSALGSLGPPEAAAVAIWLGAVVVGLRTLTGTLRTLIRREPTEEQPVDRDGDQARTS